MHLLLGLLVYVVAVVAIGSGAAALLSSMNEPVAGTATARREPTAAASPRIQAWLERKAEGVAYAEKEKAAAQAEREQADALRARLAATPEPYRAARAQPDAPQTRDVKERHAAERDRAPPRAKQRAKQEARRRLRDLETHTEFGYVPEPRGVAYNNDFLTKHDRDGN